MRSRDTQQQATQAVAWLWVVVVHAGLFWLLAHQGRGTRAGEEGERLRLVFVGRPPPVSADKIAPGSGPGLVKRDKSPASKLPASPSAPAVESIGPLPDPVVAPGELLEQARQWAREQAEPDFGADPFRSRRAQLPGGERAGAFRMREPPSPARVVGLIARTFGDKDPCPNIRSRISGLLAATSDYEREILQEELRRDREYCRP